MKENKSTKPLLGKRVNTSVIGLWSTAMMVSGAGGRLPTPETSELI